MLTHDEKTRYARQLIIEGWDEEAQARLKESTVFIAGAGGLGSPVAYYLAAAGVGRIRLCDDGSVEKSNLNRQILYGERDIGRPKPDAAAAVLENTNPHTVVVPLPMRIEEDSVATLSGDADVLVDCLDNFETRLVLNGHAVRAGVPLVHAGVSGLTGQVTFLDPPRTPCLACIFPDPPSAAGAIPVAGITPGLIGVIEAHETIKHLTGIGDVMRNRLLIWEGESGSFDEVTLARDPACPVCSHLSL
jgi:molybdopterin/thiamine biosynthesis adenylyltransferase